MENEQLTLLRHTHNTRSQGHAHTYRHLATKSSFQHTTTTNQPTTTCLPSHKNFLALALPPLFRPASLMLRYLLFSYTNSVHISSC